MILKYGFINIIILLNNEQKYKKAAGGEIDQL
jgi:hypothetical protein